MTVVKDFFGNLIEAPCNVLYPVRQRSSLWLETARIDEVGEDDKGPYLSGYKPEGRRIRLRKLSTVVVYRERDNGIDIDGAIKSAAR